MYSIWQIKLIFYAEHGESEYGGKIIKEEQDKDLKEDYKERYELDWFNSTLKEYLIRGKGHKSEVKKCSVISW